MFDFATKESKHHTPPVPGGGHGGGDDGISEAFLQAVRQRSQAPLRVKPLEMLESHLLVFAAEKSRLEGRTVDFEEYTAKLGVHV